VFRQQLNICQQAASYVLPQTVQPLPHWQPLESILIKLEAPTAPQPLPGHADNISNLISICKPGVASTVAQVADSNGSTTAEGLRVAPEGMSARGIRMSTCPRDSSTGCPWESRSSAGRGASPR
jgi:hypothetical protein